MLRSKTYALYRLLLERRIRYPPLEGEDTNKTLLVIPYVRLDPYRLLYVTRESLRK
jgi:hypothetical protein